MKINTLQFDVRSKKLPHVLNFFRKNGVMFSADCHGNGTCTQPWVCLRTIFFTRRVQRVRLVILEGVECRLRGAGVEECSRGGRQRVWRPESTRKIEILLAAC